MSLYEMSDDEVIEVLQDIDPGDWEVIKHDGGSTTYTQEYVSSDIPHWIITGSSSGWDVVLDIHGAEREDYADDLDGAMGVMAEMLAALAKGEGDAERPEDREMKEDR